MEVVEVVLLAVLILTGGAVSGLHVLPERSECETPVRNTTARPSSPPPTEGAPSETPKTWSPGPTDSMTISPTISVHLVPLARDSFSPLEAARTPLRNQTLLSLERAHTAWPPTLTWLSGEDGTGLSRTAQEVPAEERITFCTMKFDTVKEQTSWLQARYSESHDRLPSEGDGPDETRRRHGDLTHLTTETDTDCNEQIAKNYFLRILTCPAWVS